MSDREQLTKKLQEEIHRCKTGKLDSQKECDMGLLPLAALNTRLSEYDKRIAEAQAELNELLAAADVISHKEDLGEDKHEQWDVFLSYQRDSEAEARELYQKLTDAGLRVWQDVNNIRHTERWSESIHTALQRSKRLVLLMTQKAMDSREVGNEWYFFYTKEKPLHCLLLETCNIRHQLLPYQYVDWREPKNRDWARLIRELRADFAIPMRVASSPIVELPAARDVNAESPFVDLLLAARDPDGSIALTADQIKHLVEHKPHDLAEYRLGRIAEWSQPRYALDNRFVNLTLLLDKGEDAQQRWQNAEDARFNDLRDVLAKVDEPALVILGAPGSGKSTLLRRFQIDHSLDQIRADGPQVTFFIPLNAYRGTDAPRQWLNDRWNDRYPTLPPLDHYLREGRVILLLDAINEMPHKSSAEYHEKVNLWRGFTQAVVEQGNRAIFSCRSLDYSASLSSKELRVPQVEVQPMTEEQVRDFIGVYSPTHADTIWRDLDGTPQFDLFRTPIYLKLLLDQVERHQRVPRGKAELFTQFVRQQISRNREHPLLLPNGLLTDRDHNKLTHDAWKSPFELPDRGLLLNQLSTLAFTMQEKGLETEGALVRIDYDDACGLLDKDRAQDILVAGVALTVLDEDITRDEITFFHQLLQEFFAARKLAQTPNPALVHVEWHVDHVRPTLAETLAALADGDPLPPLPQTGWEETTLTAAPMAKDPNAFIRDLMPHNLALAARCAASPEVKIDAALKYEIQQALIARSQDFQNADLRARIAAGLALGELGDPRFERRTGTHGDYLLPPLIDIPAGTYPIGDDASSYDDEKPAHTVTLDAFQIGAFAVTNAEYALFLEAGGYEDEQWWDTDEALAWLRGEGSTDGMKQDRRNLWKNLRDNWTDDEIKAYVPERFTSEQAEWYIWFRNLSEEAREERLTAWYPEGKTYRQPEYWDDTRFNSPSLPVVGVTWFEARAYCNWLTANVAASTPSSPTPSSPALLPEGEGSYTMREMARRAMVHIAQDLRQRQTPAESVLWECIRDRRLAGLKFRRQHPVANTSYVVDFFCYEHRLVVELDGPIHEQQQEADTKRQDELEASGLTVIRFNNEAVFDRLESVLTRILQAVGFPLSGSSSSLLSKGSFSPLPEGEGSGVRAFTLPTEAHFEAAARGTAGREYPYGGPFDVTRGNTFESHIRRTTPVGIFDNATPEGAFDLTGNAYTWTTSVYDQEAFPYPYHAEDGREDISTAARRVLRGGSWNNSLNYARAASRYYNLPFARNYSLGFRLCVAPSL